MNLNEAYEFYAKHGGVGGTAKQLKETPCTLNQIKAATENVLNYHGKNYDAELKRQALQAETLLCLSKGFPLPNRNAELAEINKEQNDAQKILVDYFPKTSDPPYNPYDKAKIIKETSEFTIDDLEKAINEANEDEGYYKYQIEEKQIKEDYDDNDNEFFKALADNDDNEFFKALADMEDVGPVGDAGQIGPQKPKITNAFATISSISRINNDYFIKLKEVNGDYCIRVPKDTDVLLKTNAYEYKVTPNALSIGDRICVTGYVLSMILKKQ